MKDPSKTLRTAYYSALNGNVTYNSVAVPVYDHVPTDATYPYIKLGQYTATDDSDKTEFAVEAQQEVLVVSKFDKSYGGKAESDDIANSVIQLIRKRTVLNLSPTFLMITSILLNTNTIETMVEDGYMVTRFIVFGHRIQEP